MADSEVQLLGALLLFPEAVEDCEHLAAIQFADWELGRLFESLVTLHGGGMPIHDIRALIHELAAMQAPPACLEPKYLGRLIHQAAPRSGVRWHADQISQAWHLRRLQDLATELARRAGEPKADPAAIARWIESEVSTVSPDRQEPRTFSSVATEWLASLREPAPPATVGTGLARVDDSFGLWHATELIVLAARPGIGKTSLALQIAEQQAAQGNPVLFVSLEMRDQELVQRALVRAAGINGRELRKRQPWPTELADLEEAAEKYAEQPFWVWSPASASMRQVRGVAKRMRAKHPLSLIVVDYVSRIHSEDRGAPRHQQVATVTWGCKTLAKECNCPVLLLAQLNRESTKDTVPRLSHLAESGSLEQDADTVLFLHPKTKVDVDLICAKNRHGETGLVTLYWDGEATRFEQTRRIEAFDDWNRKEDT